MKINLITSTMNDSPSIADHQNILLDKIDEVNNGLCTSIMMQHVLQYLSIQQLENVLSKLRHGGILNIHAIDISLLAKGLYWGEIDIQKFSSILEGSISYHSAEFLKAFLEQRGYVIEHVAMDIDTFSFILRAKRP